MSDIGVSRDGFVATVEMRRPPHNFFDSELIAEIGEAFERLDADPAAGRSCSPPKAGRSAPAPISRSAWRPARSPKGAAAAPAGTSTRRRCACSVPASRSSRAVHGAAVGGGLGLALVADFRVTCQEARFSANFNRLGFHPGFGLTATLPRLVGAQQAALMFYTGRRIPGDEAVRIGLADVLVPQAEVRSAAQALALEIAQSAPLAVMSTRETLRRGLCDAIEAATERELVEQDWLRRTEDFKEGVKAMAERRLPDFQGR